MPEASIATLSVGEKQRVGGADLLILDEVLQIADTVTVIRRGRTVATNPMSELTARQLAELMVGSELPTPETRPASEFGDVRFVVEGLGIRDPESER
jgi:general nucleoside transport system ATP-binding protein